MDKLYWGLVMKQETIEEVVNQKQDVFERIQNEPWSLLVSEE